MPEANPAAAPSNPQPSASVSAPAAPSIPDGFVQVRKDEYESYRKGHQDWESHRPLVERVRGLGFNSDKDVERWAPAFEAINKGRYTPEFLTGVLGGPPQPEDPSARGGDKPPVDPAKIQADTLKEFDRRQATRDLKSAREKEPELITASARELLGDKASEYDVKVLARQVRAEAHERRELLPDDHPLKDEALAPLSKALVNAIAKEMVEEAATARGTAAAAKAQRLAKTPASAGAGPATGMGGPTAGDTKEDFDSALDSRVEDMVSIR